MKCYVSKLKVLGLLGLTCIMVASAYFCTTLDTILASIIGWFGIGFFGLGFIVLPIRFFRRAPQVIINDEGIEDRRLKIGVIRWEDVIGLGVGSVHSCKFLCIEVSDPEKYLSKLSRRKKFMAAANEALGFPALCITFSGLEPGFEQVWAYLNSRRGPLGKNKFPKSALPSD